MLLPSNRHRPEDLELWAELEQADRAYNRRHLARREAEALRTIAEFARQPCYLSVSGGKDSSVLWALVHRSGLVIPAYHVRTEPLEDPHVADVLAALQERFPLPFTEVVNWCTRDARGWHATGTLEAGIREIERRAGTRRHLSGIRAEESLTRRISAWTWGQTCPYSCRPLLFWTSQQIFAYAAWRNVPLHPNYAMLGGGRWKRERLRVAFLDLTHGRQFGRAQWEWEYYGDIIRRLAAGQVPPHRQGPVRRDGPSVLCLPPPNPATGSTPSPPTRRAPAAGAC